MKIWARKIIKLSMDFSIHGFRCFSKINNNLRICYSSIKFNPPSIREVSTIKRGAKSTSVSYSFDQELPRLVIFEYSPPYSGYIVCLSCSDLSAWRKLGTITSGITNVVGWLIRTITEAVTDTLIRVTRRSKYSNQDATSKLVMPTLKKNLRNKNRIGWNAYDLTCLTAILFEIENNKLVKRSWFNQEVVDFPYKDLLERISWDLENVPSFTNDLWPPADVLLGEVEQEQRPSGSEDCEAIE